MTPSTESLVNVPVASSLELITTDEPPVPVPPSQYGLDVSSSSIVNVYVSLSLS